MLDTVSGSRRTELAGPLTAEAIVRLFERIIDEARRPSAWHSDRRSEDESGQFTIGE